MTKTISTKWLWHEGKLQQGLGLRLEDGHVSAIEPVGEDADAKLLVAPALTDLQVNGSGGLMLNSEPTEEGIKTIVRTQRSFGTGWVMPTLITCEHEKLERVVEAAIAAKGFPGFLGLHIEGPHISVARKGTHDPRFIRPFDEKTLGALKTLREHDIPVMHTLAPENAGPDVIAELHRLGVIVSAGHTEATPEQVRAALDAGLSCFTHLFNGMPPMTSRAPGIVGTALNSLGYCGMIADGHHVSWDMLRIAYRARPEKGRIFLVSDAMSTIGGPDHFELYGERIEVRDGALVNAAGSLAGAHIDLATSVKNAVEKVGLALDEAYAMAAMVPYDVMGLPRPEITVGTPVDEIIAFDAKMNRIAL